MKSAAALALVAAMALTGCQDDESPVRYETYVAMGDSFTSGSGLPGTLRGQELCGISRHNYPHLVAEELGADLTDVSCGGAGTGNGTQAQPFGTAGSWPPQLDAVERGTDLVTVGLGANDSAWYFGTMFGCTQAAASDPEGNPCERAASAGGPNDLTQLPAQIGQRLETLLRQVQERAPTAKVLLVGYPQPVPEHDTCPELPLADGDYPFVRAQWVAMNDAMRAAADAAGATFVDVLAGSEGHDICAGDDAWVNGFENRPGVASSYHPLVRGQRGVAGIILDTLRG